MLALTVNNMTTVSDSNPPILQPFGPDLWIAQGPVVDFYGFPYPTRMVVVRLASGASWIWSPISYSRELAQSVEQTCGFVEHIVAPNKIHWLFIKEWAEQYPSAQLYAAPGLKERRVARDIQFDTVLGDTADPSYSSDFDQVIFRGSPMDEVVFFHRKSKTAIFCDLIQRFPRTSGWKGQLMKLDGLVGEKGSTPREWRFLFWWNGHLDLPRKSLDKVLWDWQPDRLVIAHGECATDNAVETIRQCLEWIPKDPRPREGCGCCAKHRSGKED